MTREKIASIILFIMPFVFAWILVGQILQSRLTVEQLIKVTGIIENSREVTTHIKKGIFYTHKDLELRIFLKDKAEYFRIIDVYRYQRFRTKIINGDTAEIFIRPKWLLPLGLGLATDVYQMNINGQTIFGISETHRNENGIIIVSLIAIPLFIFMGTMARKKALQKEKERQNKLAQYTTSAQIVAWPDTTATKKEKKFTTKDTKPQRKQECITFFLVPLRVLRGFVVKKYRRRRT